MNNTTIDSPQLLCQLAKELVHDRLGIKPEQFKTTADTAWVSLAARLLTKNIKPQRKAVSTKQVIRRQNYAN